MTTELTIDTVRPSDFDPFGRWDYSIGTAESKTCAWALCWYLAEHGNEWRPAKADDVYAWIVARVVDRSKIILKCLRKHEHDGVVAMDPMWIPSMSGALRKGPAS